MRHVITIISTLTILITTSGCESTSNRFNSKVNIASTKERICIREKKVGSHIPTVTCGSPEEIAAYEEKSKGFISNMHRKNAELNVQSEMERARQ